VQVVDERAIVGFRLRGRRVSGRDHVGGGVLRVDQVLELGKLELERRDPCEQVLAGRGLSLGRARRHDDGTHQREEGRNSSAGSQHAFEDRKAGLKLAPKRPKKQLKTGSDEHRVGVGNVPDVGRRCTRCVPDKYPINPRPASGTHPIAVRRITRRLGRNHSAT